MKTFTTYCVFLASLALAGCASTIQIATLAKPKNPGETVLVSQFRYGGGSTGLDAGTYTIEYESPEGFFYRGPGLPVKLDPVLNMNRANYPDSKFPGGLFIPVSRDPRGYRLYYYQVNIPPRAPDTAGLSTTTQGIALASAPAASPLAAGVGAGVASGIIGYMIESGRGQIVVAGPTSDIDISSYVLKQ
jgi:hypothetical protein